MSLTTQEVKLALDRVSFGKSTGVDSMPDNLMHHAATD